MQTLFGEIARAGARACEPALGLAGAETPGSVTVVRAASGTLGPRNSAELGRKLASLTGPGAQVVIDLSGVDDIDEAGCGMILASQRRLSGEGGRLHVCGLSRPVRLRFQVARMHRRLEVFNTEREAIKAFRG